MRTVFTIELRVDIPATDETRRKAFIDLSMTAARQLYGQASMLAKQAPEIKVKTAGKEFPLFPENGEKEDEEVD